MLGMSEFLKAINSNPDTSKAIVVLPDIWGQTNYAVASCQEFSNQFNQPCYLLDYFYQLTNQANNFSPDKDQAVAVGLMQELKGEDFVLIFEQALELIKKAQPKISELSVVGFCFGGRLAYLSGLSSSVKKIISFYGAGAHSANYYQDRTPVGALCDVRAGDASLQVLSFYGTADASIPAADITKTAEQFKHARISYSAKQYFAGHAYFQPGRDSYDLKAATSSWQDLAKLLA